MKLEGCIRKTRNPSFSPYVVDIHFVCWREGRERSRTPGEGCSWFAPSAADEVIAYNVDSV